MKICFISHPIGGNVEENLKHLRKVIARINECYSNVVPFCPYYGDVVSLDDSDPLQRKRGMSNALAILARGKVDELWLTGDKVTEGMAREKEMAEALGIPVIDYTGNF